MKYKSIFRYKMQEEKTEYNIVVCPHCSSKILIFNNEIACAIFRHGVYKSNGQQMNPDFFRFEIPDNNAAQEPSVFAGQSLSDIDVDNINIYETDDDD
jgi:DNA-directed RNA polymerase subunit RPC12/RpoP